MPAWLWPAISAATSAVGGVLGNRSSAKEAQRNRQFQERMSSTAAQRGVKDYTAAGLNPALAYERPASSPGGSMASQDDPIAGAVSSAMAAKQLQANVELTKAQTEKVHAEKAMIDTDLNVRTVTQDNEPTWREAQIQERIARLRDLAHTGRLQPHDERLRALAVAMQKALLAGTEFRAETFGDIDAVRDFVRKGLSSAGDAAEAFRAWMNAGGSRMSGYKYGNDKFDAQREAAKKPKPKGGGW